MYCILGQPIQHSNFTLSSSPFSLPHLGHLLPQSHLEYSIPVLSEMINSTLPPTLVALLFNSPTYSCYLTLMRSLPSLYISTHSLSFQETYTILFFLISLQSFLKKLEIKHAEEYLTKQNITNTFLYFHSLVTILAANCMTQ